MQLAWPLSQKGGSDFCGGVGCLGGLAQIVIAIGAEFPALLYFTVASGAVFERAIDFFTAPGAVAEFLFEGAAAASAGMDQWLFRPDQQVDYQAKNVGEKCKGGPEDRAVDTAFLGIGENEDWRCQHQKQEDGRWQQSQHDLEGQHAQQYDADVKENVLGGEIFFVREFHMISSIE